MKITQEELMEDPNIKMSDQERFIAIIKWFDLVHVEEKKQTAKLNSINTTLNIFLVIVIIGVVISACNAIIS